MQLKECYEAFNGDYESVTQRISKEDRLRKFVKMFLTEPSFQILSDALAAENYPDAFRAAHSLKGICINLGFRQLEQTSSVLTNYLRHCEEKEIDKEECMRLFEDVSKDYQIVVDAIKQLDEA